MSRLVVGYSFLKRVTNSPRDYFSNAPALFVFAKMPKLVDLTKLRVVQTPSFFFYDYESLLAILGELTTQKMARRVLFIQFRSATFFHIYLTQIITKIITLSAYEDGTKQMLTHAGLVEELKYHSREM